MPETKPSRGTAGDPRLTLKWFFWDEAGVTLETEKSDQAVGPLDAVRTVFDNVVTVEWQAVSSELDSQLEELLQFDLGEVIVSAWESHRLLAKYADSEAYPPNQTILVPVAQHQIESTHQPYIEIKIDEAAIGRLDFDIRLTLDLEGLVLKVRDGQVREVCGGACRGAGTLRCGDVVLKEHKARRFDLPGKIDLGEGIAIPGG